MALTMTRTFVVGAVPSTAVPRRTPTSMIGKRPEQPDESFGETLIKWLGGSKDQFLEVDSEVSKTKFYNDPNAPTPSAPSSGKKGSSKGEAPKKEKKSLFGFK
eukprot:jgi/Mesvir1/11968/Mv00287-RA.1